jgi:ATP-dependent RNA helicase DHX57
MGKIKNRDAKKAANKVFSSGGGGGSKAEAAAFLASKQEKELKCPHCDRIFKQQGRLTDHIQKRHGSTEDGSATAATPATPATVGGPAPGTTSTRIMDIGSKVRAECRSSATHALAVLITCTLNSL